MLSTERISHMEELTSPFAGLDVSAIDPELLEQYLAEEGVAPEVLDEILKKLGSVVKRVVVGTPQKKKRLRPSQRHAQARGDAEKTKAKHKAVAKRLASDPRYQRSRKRQAMSEAVDLTLQFGSELRSAAQDWTLSVLSADRNGPGRYAVQGYLWKHKEGSKHFNGGAYASYTGTLVRKGSKFEFLEMRFQSNRIGSGNLMSQANEILKTGSNSKNLAKLLDRSLPAEAAAPNYRGKLPIAPLDGHWRAGVTTHDVERYGIRSPFAGAALVVLPPEKDPNKAEAAGKKSNREKERATGAMTALVGLIKWTQTGEYSPIVASYYSAA